MAKKNIEDMMIDDGPEVDDTTMASNLVDYFTPHIVVRAGGKIRSFSFDSKDSKGGGMQVCLTLVFLLTMLMAYSAWCCVG